MRRLGVIGLGVLAILVVFASGFAVSSFNDGEASAQTEEGWSVITADYVCFDCSVQSPDESAAEKAELGDPAGQKDIAINIIAELEQDGCEWQWHGSGGDIVILFRC